MRLLIMRLLMLRDRPGSLPPRTSPALRAPLPASAGPTFIALASPLQSVLRGLLLGLLCTTATLTQAKSVRTDYVESELVARTSAIEPGGKVLLGLRLKMDAHWHTYWENPGDSGMPTTIQWKLPAGFKAGPIQWPLPQRLPIPPLMNYGYENEIVLPVDGAVLGETDRSRSERRGSGESRGKRSRPMPGAGPCRTG